MLSEQLSAPGMFRLIGREFSKIPDDRQIRSNTVSIKNAALAAAAMFELKSPSMLQFEDSANDETVKHNITTLFGITTVPSDTTMREVLDPVEKTYFQDPYKKIFSMAQRGKVFEGYRFLDDGYLLSVDGTGFFSSSAIHCDNCNVKNHRDGTFTYYHQMLTVVLVHPDRKEVIPFAPEPISHKDGTKKNDCERNAANRLLERLRREHPHLKIIIVEDGLASNGPHIRKLQECKMSYILGCKPGDHGYLFDFVNQSEKLGTVHRHSIIRENVTGEFRWMNQVPLNDCNNELLVNFLEYQETSSTGEIKKFSWVTDIEINENNVEKIIQGGKARWKIESVP